MTVGMLHLVHQALFGALAASGFSVMFNFGWRQVPWCAASGALALTIRTLGQVAGWNLETASFAAAMAVGCAARLLVARLGSSRNTFAAVGCIPMVPGSFAAQAIFGLFGLTGPNPHDPAKVAMSAMEFTLRVMFTIGAMGAGLSITTHLLPHKEVGE